MVQITPQQEKAIAAAERLLNDVCNEQQREEYKSSGVIRIHGKSGEIYTVDTRDGAVRWRGGLRSGCFGFKNVLSDMIPHHYDKNDLKMFFIDKAVAVKLVIEWNEQLFLAVAGRDGATIP